MIILSIKNQVDEITEQIKRSFTDNKGLVLVVSSNQNWTAYMSMVVLNIFNDLTALRRGDQSRQVVTIGEKDQYSWDDSMGCTTVAVSELTPEQIVYARAIRNTEKAQDVLTAANTCLVVAIVHVISAQGVSRRFEDMGIEKKMLESTPTIVIENV